MWDGLDRRAAPIPAQPFHKGTGQSRMLVDLIRTSVQDRKSFHLQACGRVEVFLTRSERIVIDGGDGKTWKDLYYRKESKAAADELSSADSARGPHVRQWPNLPIGQKLLVVDADDVRGIEVLKLSQLCRELDEDPELAVVSGEIAGDFTPCKVTRPNFRLLHCGSRQVGASYTSKNIDASFIHHCFEGNCRLSSSYTYFCLQSRLRSPSPPSSSIVDLR